MAVYKSTYCYPYLNSLDVRVTPKVGEGDSPAEFLGCKVDTSNTQITGYSIRLYDEENNLVFPAVQETISPLSELKDLPFSDVAGNGTNSGWNGTRLQIPFFQNLDMRMVGDSSNALYYRAQYAADHVILDKAIADSLGYGATFKNNRNENISRWKLDTTTGYLKYEWPKDASGKTVYDNKIVLDGEYAIIGDVILAMAGTSGTLDANNVDEDRENRKKIGLWTVAQSYDTALGRNMIVLKPLAKLGGGKMVVVTKGNFFHNRSFRMVSGSGTDTYSYVQAVTEGMWQDRSGNLYDLSRYKRLTWTITLYQGNGTVSNGTMDYSTIGRRWFDMTVGSGTILGSTPTRIQIANREPAASSGGAVAGGIEKVYLPGSDSGDIVLQGTYINVGQYTMSGEGKKFFGTARVHVKNYDTSYGHVYPDTNQNIDAAAISSSTHCQFFKHSNNPNEILDTDIVTWGISFNIDLYTPNESDPTKQYIAIYNDESHLIGGQTVLDRYQMQNGDLVVLTGQNRPEQNGVYEYNFHTNGTVVGDTTFHHFLKRAASYKDWSAYIGKIIYVQKGDWSGQNVESLAPAGTYTLWNPESSISGSSALVLVAERPILLFPQLLGANHKYNLCCTMANDQSDKHISIEEVTKDQDVYTLNIGEECLIDRQTVSVGDIVFFTHGGNTGRVTSIAKDPADNKFSVTFDNMHFDPPKPNEDYLYFTKGSEYGNLTFQWNQAGSSMIITWDLNTAVILKNRQGRTYISPNISIEKGMALKFTQGNTVTLQGKSEGTEWITINNYNKTLHYIDHAALSKTSNGIKSTLVASDDGNTVMEVYGLASYSTEDGVPWKYEIRSYFNRSNGNSFYLCQTPYVLLKRDGQYYTGLEVGNSLDKPLDSPTITEIEGSTSSGIYPTLYYVDQNTIQGRSISLSATYVQFDQISWESYRWMLLDSEGSLLQDTGLQYDGVIGTTFYGLSNETGHIKVYYAVLSVTDERQNILNYIIKLNVGQTVSASASLIPPFTAETDCQTHSVLLGCQSISKLLPTYRNNGIYEAYDPRNESEGSPWDGGIVYSRDGYMSITGREYGFDRLVDYTAGSTLSGSDAIDFNLGNGVEHGVTYSTCLPLDEYSSTTGSTIKLSSDNNGDGEFYLDTQVQLGDNFSGSNIVTMLVEPEEQMAGDEPVNTTGDVPLNRSGYLEISLSIPDRFVLDNSGNIEVGGGEPVTKNYYWNTIQLNMVANGKLPSEYWVRMKDYNSPADIQPYYVESVAPETEPSQYIVGKDETTKIVRSTVRFGPSKDNHYEWAADNDRHTFHYLQKETLYRRMVVENFGLYGSLDRMEFLEIPSYKPFIYRNHGSYLGFFGKPLGNLNLVRNGDIEGEISTGTINQYAESAGSPSFWVEDRKYTKLAKDTNDYLLDKNFSSGQVWVNIYTDTQSQEGGMLKWPGSTEEGKSYWNEGPDGSAYDDGIPTQWSSINGDVDGLVYRMVAVDRHPQSLSDKTYRITMRCYDTKALYKLAYEKPLQDQDADVVSYSYDGTSNSFDITVSQKGTKAKLFVATLQVLRGDVALDAISALNDDSNSETKPAKA